MSTQHQFGGTDNHHAVMDDPSAIYTLGGSSNLLELIDASNTNVFLSGSGNSLVFADNHPYSGIAFTDHNDTVTVKGTGNTISFDGSHMYGLTVDDTGHGTTINLSPAGSLTLADFQHDAGGKINVSALGWTPAQAASLEHADGSGGCVIYLGFTTLHFVGDAHVTASHFA